MKKTISILLTFVIMLTAIIVCADTPAQYDYSSFVGEWHKVDPDALNGDVPLNIIEVVNNKDIILSLDNETPITATIQDNQAKWTEEWYDGTMGLTLTFYDDRIHLQYSRYSSEWYNEIIFVSDSVKPKRLGNGNTTDVQKDIVVLVDGNKLTFDQPPVIVNERVLVPMRPIFEALGADVEWDGENKVVISKKDYLTIGFVIGIQQMYIECVGDDLATEKYIDVSPMIIGDRTFIPLRAVADAFGASVDWIADSRTVIIKQAIIPDKGITINNYDYSHDNETLYIASTVNTTLSALNEALKQILEEKDIVVKRVYSYPNPYIYEYGYNVVVDLDYSAKNKFYSLFLQDEVNATILSIDDVFKYALLLDGNKEWYDGHREGSMGDWRYRDSNNKISEEEGKNIAINYFYGQTGCEAAFCYSEDDNNYYFRVFMIYNEELHQYSFVVGECKVNKYTGEVQEL